MTRLVLLLLLLLRTGVAAGDDLLKKATPLLKDSCLDCHDAETDTPLNLRKLSRNLSDSKTFATWEEIYDRVRTGEMPPRDHPRPNRKAKDVALSAIRRSLVKSNLSRQQRDGRVALRRLTRTEYENTLHDLLHIDTPLKELLPEENASGGFDKVVAGQGISPLHIESYLSAADEAISAAIRLDQQPEKAAKRFLYKEQEGVRRHIDEKPDGKVVVGEVDDAIVMFSDASYIYKVHGFRPEQPGDYRIKAAASCYQSDKPVVLAINAGNYDRGSTRVLGFFDLPPKKLRKVEVVARLEVGEYLFPSPYDLDLEADGKTVWNNGAAEYEGAGIALNWIEIEGPLFEEWPPKSTRNLLRGSAYQLRDHPKWDGEKMIHYEVIPSANPKAQVTDVVRKLTVRAFRRPLKKGEAEQYIRLATDSLDRGAKLEEAVRVAARAILTSPSFLFLDADPGRLNEFALASRLSYFLWNSMPDAELFRLAIKKELSKPRILRAQVERLLDDPKSLRFKRDFARQWLQLTDIDATSPDKKLYPEFDELLRVSMLMETESFVGALIDDNLSTDNLIDSEFSYLNRRLADHYGLPGVKGQRIRKVSIPVGKVRGGVLSHASVLKVTANGTVTSPVRRGAWVMKNILGQTPKPPPPNIGSIEPDTRGTTTIREMLAAHRDNESCASCHRDIDPPGFAMECFDVIGGFRNRYRSLENGEHPTWKLHGRNIWEYRLGLPVDSAGTTSTGRSFDSFYSYKQVLMNQREQVAQNVISKLVVYATGSEIQFADRPELTRILNRTREKNFGMRTMIHEVVQSRLFQHK